MYVMLCLYVCYVCMYVMFVCMLCYVMFVCMLCLYVCYVCMYVMFVCMLCLFVCMLCLYVCLYVCYVCMYVMFVCMLCLYVCYAAPPRILASFIYTPMVRSSQFYFFEIHPTITLSMINQITLYSYYVQLSAMLFGQLLTMRIFGLKLSEVTQHKGKASLDVTVTVSIVAISRIGKKPSRY